MKYVNYYCMLLLMWSLVFILSIRIEIYNIMVMIYEKKFFLCVWVWVGVSVGLEI